MGRGPERVGRVVLQEPPEWGKETKGTLEVRGVLGNRRWVQVPEGSRKRGRVEG